MSDTLNLEIDLPGAESGGMCSLNVAVRDAPQGEERDQLIARAKELLKERDAVLVSHYYVHPDLQDLAEETGGCVADSLEMARFGRDHPAQTLVVAGVRFMGETSKILSPNKTVLVPDPDAECSLDLGCPIEDFRAFKAQHPDRTVVVYANTSAEVKAEADWVITSSVALPLVRHLVEKGEKILWAPDRHLGGYIQKETGADMVLWQGSCVVHDEFKTIELSGLLEQYPGAKVLVHPESPAPVVAQADLVGSTSQILVGPEKLGGDVFIVATDNGILHKMKQHYPHATFLAAPTAGESATCKSCAFCPWMAMNDLRNLVSTLENLSNQVEIDENVRVKAVAGLDRMLAFAADAGIGGGAAKPGDTPGIGPA